MFPQASKLSKHFHDSRGPGETLKREKHYLHRTVKLVVWFSQEVVSPTNSAPQVIKPVSFSCTFKIFSVLCNVCEPQGAAVVMFWIWYFVPSLIMRDPSSLYQEIADWGRLCTKHTKSLFVSSLVALVSRGRGEPASEGETKRENIDSRQNYTTY